MEHGTLGAFNYLQKFLYEERKWRLFVPRSTSDEVACTDGSVLCQNHYVGTNLTVYILFFVQPDLTSAYTSNF